MFDPLVTPDRLVCRKKETKREATDPDVFIVTTAEGHKVEIYVYSTHSNQKALTHAVREDHFFFLLLCGYISDNLICFYTVAV